jgi:2-dehydropantoate 2-reductase
MSGRSFSRQKQEQVKNKKILIAGTGALATLFAARLSAVGVDVTLLGTWREALEAFNTRGAQVEGEQPYPVHATSDPLDCTPARLALVLVKSWQTERAARQLADCLAADGLAVSLQNGLGNTAVLARILHRVQDEVLGMPRVTAGITTLGATLSAPGVVCLAGAGPVWLEAAPRLSPLVDILQAGGFPVEVVEDIRPRVWGKLVVNAAINPLTAILRLKNGELLTDPHARTLMGMLAREAARVAEAHGVALPFHGPERAAEEVAERTGDNLSSMLRDVLRGVPTEVDVINGAIVRMGEERNVEVSVNRLVWELVRKQSRLSSAELSDMVRLS